MNIADDKAWQPKTDNKPPVKPLKPLRPLTRKEKAFTVELIKNPKASGTQAALKTYNTTSVNTAAQIASENLRKPNVMAELAKYSGTAELKVIEAMEAEKKDYKFNPDSKVYELVDISPDHAIRLRAADSVLDRVHGKATQKIESSSTTVTLSLSLKDITDNGPPE